MKLTSVIRKIVKYSCPFGIIKMRESYLLTTSVESHAEVMQTLSNRYSTIISRYAARKNINNKSPEPYTVWFCWWQGEENMPELVKICYQQLKKTKGAHSIILITEDNYTEFISLPDYIERKVKDKAITLTHLSDIIRVLLLYQYGGLWIDATIYNFQQLPDFGNETEFFTLKRLKDNDYVPECRWTGFLVFANKGNLLFEYLKDMLFKYWEEENRLGYYFLIDYLIAIAYEKVPDIKRMIDAVPYSNPYLYWLRIHINEKFDDRAFNELNRTTQFTKLTYKDKYIEEKDGDLTYYGYIKKNINDK